jgi:rod shape-determining protein MreC
MFSKKVLMIVGVIVIFAISLTLLTVPNRPYDSSAGSGNVAIGIVAPFQKATTWVAQSLKDIWRNYFNLISVAKENRELKRSLGQAIEKNRRTAEIVLANDRLRALLNFKEKSTYQVIAAEVVGKDPSPWFKTVMIDKGKKDGVKKAMPVVLADGIVGQVVDVSDHYAKVLLVIDQNSAVDALVQRSRARGVIKGIMGGKCVFQYALRKDDISVGDIIVSSGLDGVFPKGLSIGQVAEVVRRNAGIFQEVFVAPFVDFEKLEEVLVVLTQDRPMEGQAP